MFDIASSCIDLIYSNKIFWNLFYAFFVGFIASFSYVTALYFKFVADSSKERKAILEFFIKDSFDYSAKRLSIPKIIWYCFPGGFLALVFQISLPEFVAIQSLILGIGWPLTVGQFLSKRMVALTKEEKGEMELLKEFRTSQESIKDVKMTWDDFRQIK